MSQHTDRDEIASIIARNVNRFYPDKIADLILSSTWARGKDAHIAGLAAALKPFAALTIKPDVRDEAPVFEFVNGQAIINSWTAGDLRRARSALASLPQSAQKMQAVVEAARRVDDAALENEQSGKYALVPLKEFWELQRAVDALASLGGNT